MNEQKLMDELRSRAADDAKRFRQDHPGAHPNEKWIDNSYTAALPLAKDRAGFDPGPGPHPRLFELYKREIESLAGGGRQDSEADRDRGTELIQQPTAGEN